MNKKGKQKELRVDSDEKEEKREGNMRKNGDVSY